MPASPHPLRQQDSEQQTAGQIYRCSSRPELNIWTDRVGSSFGTGAIDSRRLAGVPSIHRWQQPPSPLTPISPLCFSLIPQHLWMEPPPEYNAMYANTNTAMSTASPLNAREPVSAVTNTAQPTTSKDEEPEDPHLLVDDFKRHQQKSCPFQNRVFEQLLQRDKMTRWMMLSMVLGQWGTTLLKFSIKDDPEQQVYYLGRQTVETWEVIRPRLPTSDAWTVTCQQGLKIGVMEDMEIDMDAITDMFGDPILPAHWPLVNQEILYMYAPFVVEGKPILSRTKHRLRFVSPPGVDLYTQLLQPRNITVGQLKGLVTKLMRQMPEYASQRKAKYEIKICMGNSDSERLADCNLLDRTITVKTSDQCLIVTPASPLAKPYIAVTADWKSGDRCQRCITCNPGTILIEASTHLPWSA
ncbi:hypothetical protein FN846DRAFT_993714 [Sphaerosporella brunnea]|uniref:Uncharacterized protein n=1 Tax=Sphaerosporella brunnea TaxID=1250544 RepID=A0A5J5EMK1_9PEZI|nr:hypothetical protein FN846DRAFT_993714 [Sphaerosporella brunnea]